MKSPAAFFAELRSRQIFGDTLDQSEVDGCNAILTAMAADLWPLAWAAYGLATAYHETAHTMQPVKEYGGPEYHRRLYDVTGQNPARAGAHGNTEPGDGARYCGRGYVQLTWKVNYQKAGKALGVDLVGNPDLAMTPSVAANVMVRGMREGWFTGASLGSTLTRNAPGTLATFTTARSIINGRDKAAMIAGYAQAFQSALRVGEW